MYDILSIEKVKGLKSPDWAADVYPEKLLTLAERSMAILTENDFMKRMKGGRYFGYFFFGNMMTLSSIFYRHFLNCEKLSS